MHSISMDDYVVALGLERRQTFRFPTSLWRKKNKCITGLQDEAHVICANMRSKTRNCFASTLYPRLKATKSNTLRDGTRIDTCLFKTTTNTLLVKLVSTSIRSKQKKGVTSAAQEAPAPNTKTTQPKLSRSLKGCKRS